MREYTKEQAAKRLAMPNGSEKLFEEAEAAFGAAWASPLIQYFFSVTVMSEVASLIALALRMKNLSTTPRLLSAAAFLRGAPP